MKMPAQNRVNPFGEIISYPEQGKFLGNRGELKVDENRLLVGLSRWKSQSWIYCSLDKRFEPKKGDKPLLYTKLFFMDEFTALAAGHRPCGYCLPDRFEVFITAWLAKNPEYGYGKNDCKKIDRILHYERKNNDRSKQTYLGKLAYLPDGVMVTLDVASGESFLLQDRLLRKWSPTGYAEGIYIDPGTDVQVLTPKSIVNTIAAGFLRP
ncbi:MAG: hypothetical protein AB9919_13045 [Geobacteraceae bacterium]